MNKIITKNDLWRILGIILLVGGQFTSKENYTGFGVTMETNLVQIVGALLLLLPFVLRGMAFYREKKTNGNLPQQPPQV